MIDAKKRVLDNPRYAVALRKYRQFLSLISDRKEQVSRLVEWLENRTNWLVAPASSRFHLNFEGGLLIHSVGVTESLFKLRDCLGVDYSDETCVIVALFHDVGKVGNENEPLYVENPDEAGRKSQPFVRNPNIVSMGLGVRSLFILRRFVDLTDEEAQAVCYHDGQYIPDNRSVALKERPLLLMLHFADLWTTQVIETENFRK